MDAAAKRKLIAKHLGSLEADVMQAVWEQPDSSVRDVLQVLPGKRSRAYTTVMTVMNRLYEKGLLRRTPAGRAYLYSAAMNQDEFIASVSRKVVQTLLKDFGDLAVTQFIGEVRDSRPNDADRIRELLESSDA